MWNLFLFIPFIANLRSIFFPASGILVFYALFPNLRILISILWAALAFVHYSILRLGIPFTRDLWSFIWHPSSFWDSVRYIGVQWDAIILIGISLIGFKEAPSLWVWLPIFALSGMTLFEKKKDKTIQPISFPYETFIPVWGPVLRKTVAFHGKKQFSAQMKGKPHVIFLFLESFRAKNVGCLGAKIPASPCFDALAEKGVLFRKFCASGLQTHRALLASLFGIPPCLDTLSLKTYSSIPLIGLPEILKKNGYQTALMQGGSAVFDWTYPFFKAHGFDTIVGKEEIEGPKTSWGVSDESLYCRAMDWMERQKSPVFLSLFTISNHHPWVPPAGWEFPVDGVPDYYRRYLQTFSYTDHCLGRFVEQLKGDAIFFILGDHGQSMGERASAIEIHNDLFQENIHVPLLILGKGIDPKIIDAPASQMDLLPTVLDLLEIPAIHHSLGKSLLREDPSPAFFSLPKGERGCLQGSLKLIGDAVYDLDKDPEELMKIEAPADLREETDAFYTNAEVIYQKQLWSPSEEMELPVIDVSGTGSLTDAAFIGSKIAWGEIHELNISNCPLLTDRSLCWIAEHCAHLMILNASHNPLLTQEGVHAVLQNCRQLRHLSLEGVDELVDLTIPSNLKALHLKDCFRFQGNLAASQLIYFAASLENVRRDEFLKLGGDLHYCALADGKWIDDEALAHFLKQNPHLSILSLDGFPHLSKIVDHSNLRQMKISNCPNLTDEGIESLSALPLNELNLSGCPKLTGKGLEKLAGCKLLISDCSGILPEMIISLRSHGCDIF